MTDLGGILMAKILMLSTGDEAVDIITEYISIGSQQRLKLIV
jgi:hypothetical protein